MGKRILFAAAAAVLFLAAGAQSALAQGAREVTGKVTQTGGTPLQDASVNVLGQAIGIRTNERGEFRLRVPAGEVTLQARAIGFKRVTTRVAASQSRADFTLEKDVLQLEGVTVTGVATTIEKRLAATAVSSVNAAQLTAVPSVSLENSLQGKVVGASISMNNGAPGGGGQVQIRGASSLIGRIDPLYVIDGVIISNAVRSNRLSTVTGSLNSGEENGTNRLSDINPADIENIEVLKGAAASAIYGSQATNGVIVITTKKGAMGQPRFNVSQRFGTYQLIRKRGSRHFTPETIKDASGNSEMAAVIAANCVTTCPYYDYQQELYGRNDLSSETVISLSGGANNTRYFVSAHDRQDAGIAINTGARRQSIRANLDQAVGSKLTINVGTNVMHSFSQRGISNNDNAFSSPIYGLGYTPAIANLNTRDAGGHFPLNPFPAGYKGSANPFQTFTLLQNNEDVYRMILSGRVNYSAWSDDHNNVNLSFTGGADRFSNENYIVAPTELQFQRPGANQAGQYPGVVIQGDGTNLLTNATLGGTWAYTSGWGSSTMQVGLQLEDRKGNDYNITGRGLGPLQKDAAGAANTTVSHAQSAVSNQAYYVQEEAQLLGERLYVSAAVRGEKSSVNGDRDKVFTFPRYAASYRWHAPRYLPYTDEIKFRANFGESGNQPNYGDRDLTLTSYGLIGGLAAYGLPSTAGNPFIEPERLAEKEFGIDASFLRERVHIEATYFKRNITNLLVRPLLAMSTGVSQTTVNGGEMESKGWEIGTTFSVLQGRDLSWLSRVNWTQNSARITKFPPGVLPFTIGAAGGFGNAYGRLRFEPGYSASQIYGNVKLADGSTKTGAPIADANPTYLMTFSNEFTWKRLSASILVDYRRGGSLSNMTLNIFDEGLNTWDYDKPAPDGSGPLGLYRYSKWAGGGNTPVYIHRGDFTKVREINVGYDLSSEWVSKIPGARTARVSVAGRNLWTISGYNGFDPEVNNGGNQVARFVDLAPFPPSRNVFFTIDIGF